MLNKNKIMYLFFTEKTSGAFLTFFQKPSWWPTSAYILLINCVYYVNNMKLVVNLS